MSAHHYHADAWGGTQVDAYYGGGAPSSALAPSSAQAVQAAWDETVEVFDERYCQTTSQKTGKQCRAYPKKGTPQCIYHSPRVSADDGAVS